VAVAEARPLVRYGTPAGRWVLVATILGSGLASLDATVVNIALPTIGRDLDADLASLQWVVNAYTLTLSGFLLLGGSLGDRYGRRRVFTIGVTWFAAASLLCAVAPTSEALIGARALQGVGAALLTPGSLAIIEAVFEPKDRGAAIGAWSGLSGVAVAAGPFVGGWLIQAVSWRLIFVINLPLALVVLWIAGRHVPESRDPGAAQRLDLAGTALAALGLAGVIWGLIQGPVDGWGSPSVLGALAGGAAALIGFVVVEARSPHPLVPLELFSSRLFSAANVVTFVVYAALGGTFFLLPIQLQTTLGLSPLESGAALIPITVLMLLLSPRAGRLTARIGPRVPMTVGPLLAAVGVGLLARVGPGGSYLSEVLPALLVFGLGLSLTVAPLTATVLQAASEEHAGVASAVNNDVARIAGLVAVAGLPVIAGISGTDYADPQALTDGFRIAVMVCAGLCAAGGLLAWATIRRPGPPEAEAVPAERFACPIDAPPLRGAEAQG
jgi:EmrB/QacA subfamily drug resistance transporter